MKKIINGKMYDTATAKRLGQAHGGGQSFRDFQYWEERLYQKRTGEFFLHGEGGPMTRYAEHIDQNNWSGGERIIPLSVKEAREWAEENLDADDYQEIFGEVSEDGGRTVLSVSLDAATADRIRKVAAEAGMSVSAMIASKF